MRLSSKYPVSVTRRSLGTSLSSGGGGGGSVDGARQLLGEGVLLQQEAGQVAVGETQEPRQKVSWG